MAPMSHRLEYTLIGIWGISSAGRAPALHAGGQRFDPAILHQIINNRRIEQLGSSLGS